MQGRLYIFDSSKHGGGEASKNFLKQEKGVRLEKKEIFWETGFRARGSRLPRVIR